MSAVTPLGPNRPARVLIVDDERYNRRLLEAMLAPTGYQVQMAAGGREALALIADECPDLILLDVMMPDMNGYQVAAELKKGPLTRNIPIILVTALDDREARIQGLTAGAEDFLTKPVDRAELSVRVRNLLRLKAYGDYFDQQARELEATVEARTAELQTAVDALHAANERTRYTLEIAKVGIWDCNYQTGRTQWTPVLEAQYGLAPGAFEGTLEAAIARVHPDDRVAVLTTLEDGARSGEDFSVHNRSILPDGTVRWLHNIGRFQLQSDGTPGQGVGISQDVTEERLREAQHLQASKMEAVGQLAAGVAHDFNNLLTVIKGFTELVVARAEAGIQDATGKDARDLDEVTKAAASASDLTRQLLAFSRPQVLDTTPLDINALVTDMARMLTRLIGSRIEVSLTLAPGLARVQADRSQLEQVVMNLVVNARDAMPDGGRIMITTADVESKRLPFHAAPESSGSFVLMSVTDTGTGMTEETQRRLFEPFYTTKAPGKGTGLGLSTTYGIVTQTKGHIRVVSELGRGTTFTVYLPCATAAALQTA